MGLSCGMFFHCDKHACEEHSECANGRCWELKSGQCNAMRCWTGMARERFGGSFDIVRKHELIDDDTYYCTTYRDLAWVITLGLYNSGLGFYLTLRKTEGGSLARVKRKGYTGLLEESLYGNLGFGSAGASEGLGISTKATTSPSNTNLDVPNSNVNHFKDFSFVMMMCPLCSPMCTYLNEECPRHQECGFTTQHDVLRSYF